MKARLVKSGEIEVKGKRYTHDVVIEGGKVRKRKKGPSKQFREKFGHTPLSAGEEIPWGGKRLLVGTGAHGALPVMDEVLAEAKRRGYRGHCGAHIGSLSAAGGSGEGPGLRHPALHVLTGDGGDRHRRRESQHDVSGCSGWRSRLRSSAALLEKKSASEGRRTPALPMKTNKLSHELSPPEVAHGPIL
jgi:hypothetical protein